MVIYGGEEMTMRWILEGMEVPIEVMLVLFQESIPLIISQYFIKKVGGCCVCSSLQSEVRSRKPLEKDLP